MLEYHNFAYDWVLSFFLALMHWIHNLERDKGSLLKYREKFFFYVVGASLLLGANNT